MPMGTPINQDLLRRLGVTQAEVAQLLGVSQPTVHRKLHGFREWTGTEIQAVFGLLRERDPNLTYDQLFAGEDLEPEKVPA